MAIKWLWLLLLMLLLLFPIATIFCLPANSEYLGFVKHVSFRLNAVPVTHPKIFEEKLKGPSETLTELCQN